MQNLARNLILSILVAATTLLPICSFAQNSSFFPSRPPRVALQVAQGTLLDFGIGNKSGEFSIKDTTTGKTLEFYVGWPLRIDGHIVKCSIAPKDSFKPAQKFCPDWPSQIKLGQTKVKVTYWNVTHEGQRVTVSDQIDSLD
jgi:hypothetical protein